METFHSRSGMTINFPPFNPGTDHLFLAIKALLDHKFGEFSRKIERMESRQTDILSGMVRLEGMVSACLERHNLLQDALLQQRVTNDDPSQRQSSRKRLKVTPSNSCSRIFERTITAQTDGANNSLQHADGTVTGEATGGVSIALDGASPDGEDVNEADVDDVMFIKSEVSLDDASKFESFYSLNTDLPSASPTASSASTSQILVDPHRTNGGPFNPLEPVVLFNIEEKREIFLGGDPSVSLPLWAYLRCLDSIKGHPFELGPRLCLRLLQSLFGRNYMITHNYNGTCGKKPIDRRIMNAVLNQARMQFKSDHFYTDNLAYAKFRDYINNAFRVVAFRVRKGERCSTPFWDSNGEPIQTLDPPAWMTDTSGRWSALKSFMDEQEKTAPSTSQQKDNSEDGQGT